MAKERGLDRYEEVVAAYDQAIRFDPENAHAWGFKGSVLDNLNRSEEAVVALDRALRSDPKDPDLWLF
ncbi:MAG: hypothetical protein EHM53_08475 [Methanoregulaceae archaeon]|nr:MAG: hypothetical protein EHM53_08475 [Methanoregulaceae archaeon]